MKKLTLLLVLLILSCSSDEEVLVEPLPSTYLEKQFIVTEIIGDYDFCEMAQVYYFNTNQLVDLEYYNTDCIINGVSVITYTFHEFVKDSIRINTTKYKLNYIEPVGEASTYLTLQSSDRIINLKHYK